MTDATAITTDAIASMSHVHGGTCGFCGTNVKPDYFTCTGCGAMWRSSMTLGGGMLALAALPIGIVVAFVVAVITNGSFGVSMASFLLSSIGSALYGASKQEYSWFRRS